MATNVKTGGLVISGLAAYLILSKGISAVRGMIHDVTDMAKWKAYYKCMNNDVKIPVTKVLDSENNENTYVSDERLKAGIKASVLKAIDHMFDKEKAVNGALEGQTEASEGPETTDTIEEDHITYYADGKEIGSDGDMDGDSIVIARETSSETEVKEDEPVD